MKQITTKMITVDSRGYVMTSRGRVLAPIRTPYRETVDRIGVMIMQDRATVTEHLSGKKIPLTIMNFDTDNSVEKKEPAAQVEHKENPESGVRVVSDITPPDNGIPMRTGDVFSTDPAKSQHKNETPAGNPIGEQNSEKMSTTEKEPAAQVEHKENPESGVKENEVPANPNNNHQQGGKHQNNGGKPGKNKNNKDKGNKNNQNGQNQTANQETGDKKDDKTESSPDEKPAEPTTGADLAVNPESV